MSPSVDAQFDGWDLVLSSGFLAFGRHLGFMRAVQTLGIPVSGVCGTSSGALVGALWSAGVSVDAMTDLFHVPRPVTKLSLSKSPWRGVFSLAPMLEQVASLLPERIEDLGRPFGVGVTGPGKKHEILTRGPLVPALRASCAVPVMLESVRMNGAWYQDGGIVDRVGFEPWRDFRGDVPVLVHLVDRSMGPETGGLEESDRLRVVRSPRSFAKLWDLGPYFEQIEESYLLALDVVKPLQSRL